MKKFTIAYGICLSLASSLASAQDHPYVSPPGGAASPLDRGYVAMTSAADYFEILSSRLALRKTKSRAVRSLALSANHEYGFAESRLRAAATYQDYQGAAETVATPDTEASLGQLEALEGADFDKAYVASQVAFHAVEIQRNTDYSVQGSYGPLLVYEGSMLPHSRSAMQRALKIHGSMGR